MTSVFVLIFGRFYLTHIRNIIREIARHCLGTDHGHLLTLHLIGSREKKISVEISLSPWPSNPGKRTFDL